MASYGIASMIEFGRRKEIASLDLVAHLRRQREFSLRAFGEGRRTFGIAEHVRRELHEIEQAPSDLGEWIDVITLGLDGAWRCGATPEQIAAALVVKLTINECRTWPRSQSPDDDDVPIEHDRSKD